MKKKGKTADIQLRSIKLIHDICPGLLTWKMGSSLLQTLSPFITIVFSSKILDGMITGETEALVYDVVIMLGLTFLLTAISRFMDSRSEVKQVEFDNQYHFLLNRRIMEMDYTKIEDVETHRLREKIDEIRNMSGGGLHMFLTNFPTMAQNIVTVIIALLLCCSLFLPSNGTSHGEIPQFVSSGWATLFVVFLICINVYVGIYATSLMTGNMYAIMNDIMPFNRVFGYYLDNYINTYHAGKDIRIYRQQPVIHEESMALFDDCRKTLKRLSGNQKKYTYMTACAAVAVNTLIYLLVGLRALAGMVAAGMTLQYVGGLLSFVEGLTGMVTSASELKANNEAMEVLFTFLDIPSAVSEGGLRIEKDCLPKEGQVLIEFRNVSFHYPDSEIMVLKHLSVKIEAGSSVAIVGKNGSGKSTFVKLLCRLYEPTEGEILLNGIPIGQYDIRSYQDYLSVVFQDFSLFSMPLSWNVACSMEHSHDEVETCLRKAGFGGRLESMKDGVDTPLYRDFEKDGIEVSGGEAQKIALARALYKDGEIMILDEPTAALDPLAEYEFYFRLWEFSKGKTTMYISHRLSSCRFCNKILVFEQGKLVQEGDHDTLVAEQGGKYQQLWKAQAQYYT